MDILLECLSQRKQLLTVLLDLTMQMERRCTEEEVVLDDLLDKRQIFLSRLQKCADLTASAVNALPGDQREILAAATSNNHPIHPAAPPEIAALLTDCRALNERVLISDQTVRALILAKQTELRTKLEQTSKAPKNQKEIFRFT